MVNPAGKALTPGGVGFCDNTFCEGIDATRATAKHTTIATKNARTFMLYSSPVSCCWLLGMEQVARGALNSEDTRYG
jgi:hypothetical protein